MLVWYGKSHAARGQPQIERLVSNTSPVHIFWRCRDRDPFTYAGIGTAVQTSTEMPVEVVWSFDENDDAEDPANGASGSGVGTFRRGPPPAIGTYAQERLDGPTDLYLLTLEGNDQGAVLVAPPDYVVIKVGISNNLTRRLAELNAGFPPGSAVKWTVFERRTLADGYEAWTLESVRLRRLQQAGWALGGEFGLVPRAILVSFLGD